jgi:DNA-binding transcriptional ArsR family regulator
VAFSDKVKTSFFNVRSMKQLLYYLIQGTRGGEMRGRIIEFLKKSPSNANKITESLKIDYKTTRHHLEILEKHRIIHAINKGNYGAVYFLTQEFEKEWKDFEEIWKQFGKK